MACHELTSDIARLIVALVRAGASAAAAAEAAGVPRRLFVDWLRKGRDSEELPYRALFIQVVQSRGQARAAVEAEVRKKDPKFWLRYGPGQSAAKKRRKAPENEVPSWLIEVFRAAEPLPVGAREALVSCAEKLDDVSGKRGQMD